MIAHQYAEALYTLSQQPKADVKKLALGLKETLARRGHTALASRVAAELSRVEQHARGKTVVRVRIAHASLKKEALAKVEELAQEWGGDARSVEVIEDDSLISGFAIEGPGFRFDASARAALTDLYRTLTTN